MPAADDMKELVPDRVTDDIHKSAREIMAPCVHVALFGNVHDIHMCPLENDGRCIEQSLSVACRLHPTVAVSSGCVAQPSARP